MKTIAAAIIATTLTGAAAVTATQVLDDLQPKASVAVIDRNLNTVYTAASTHSLLYGQDFEQTLAAKVAELQATDDSIQYRIEDGSLIASDDFSCRRLVIGSSFVSITDC